MNLNDYQSAAKETAIYDSSMKLWYPVLGLVGEYGEWVDSTTDASDIREAGDMCWYMAAIASDLDIQLGDLFGNTIINDLVLANKDHIDFPAMFTDVAVSCIAEVVKKIFRDKDGVASDADKDRIKDCLYQLFLNIAYDLYTFHEISLDDVLADNITKLQSRKQRNVLQGSGDDR